MRQNIVPRAFRRAGLLGALALAGTALVLAPAAWAGPHGGGGGGGSHGGGGGGGSHSSGGGSHSSGGGSHAGSGGSHTSGGAGHYSGGAGHYGGGSSYRGGVRGSGWVTHSSGTHYSASGARTATGHPAPAHPGGHYNGGHYNGGHYYGGHYYGGHYWGYPGGWYSPWYWGWNSWGWGWGWGWAPYWSTWWWGGPWGGTSIYVAPEAAADGSSVRTDRYAVVKTDVTPEEAQVFLDDKYIGTAGDFDGFPDYLYLGPGTYHLEFKLPNYQTFATDLEVTRGQQLRVAQELKLEPGKSALDAFPPESKGTPLGRVFTKGGGAATGAAPRGDDGWSDRDAAPSWREPADEDRTDVRVAPAPRPSSRARINFRVTPDDAAVYMDDKYLGAADDLAANTRGVVADPGTHTITVTRPGYKSRTVEVTAHAGGQPVDVVVELEK
jgi:hypothetical protein